MKEHNHLAKNLKSYKALRKITMKELADELDIPKTTLRNIMNEGNTTLHTAIRISQGLGIGLDMLVSDDTFADKIFIMDQMQRAGSWLADVSPEKRDHVAHLMAEMWRAMGNEQK